MFSSTHRLQGGPGGSKRNGLGLGTILIVLASLSVSAVANSEGSRWEVYPRGARISGPFWTSNLPASTRRHDDPAEKPPIRFANRAAERGLDAPAKRTTLVDLDGDGWLDAVLDAERIAFQRPLPGVAGDPEQAAAATRFVDETARTGIAAIWTVDGRELPRAERPTHHVIFGDLDNDGDLDLFAGFTLEPEKWKPNPDDRSKPLRDESGARVPAKPDVGVRNAILLNDGTGRFTRVANSGVGELALPAACSTFFDFDRDGVLDLFVGHWYRSYGWSYEGVADRLYRGLGDGRFEDVTEAAGLLTPSAPGTQSASKPTFGVTAADTDGDGDDDLLVCGYGRRWNLHWRNNGDGTFTEIGAQTTFDGDADRTGAYPAATGRRPEKPFRSNGNSFDAQAIDFDDDGDVDVFLAEITHAWAGPASDRSTLLVNGGAQANHRFTRDADRGIDRVHAIERWNQGDLYCGWLDADGDTRPDLLLASGDYPDNQRLRLFRQRPDHRFEDRTEAWGIDWEGSGCPSIGDVDRDGDPDVLIGRSLFRLGKEKREALGTRPGLWLNQAPPTAHWATIALEGSGAGGTNRLGIGSKIIVEAGGRTQHRVVPGPAGHSGHQDAPMVIVGLGEAKRIDRLTIEWANRKRTRTVLEDLPSGHHIVVSEATPDEPTRCRLEPHAADSEPHQRR